MQKRKTDANTAHQEDKLGLKKERRKYPRLNRHLLLGFRPLDSLAHYQQSVTENISYGGFKVDIPFTYAPPQVNQVIEMVIRGPEEHLRPIKAIGRIAWLHEKENKQGFELGVMLTYIRKEDREKFMKYLNNAETEPKLKGEK
ncbi:MAG: PilZ domain-containing protein [Candidatus Omnitrophica bacterium]|nr:PilZ domain-containing protein [Candidatus Omnitrophota bacterium]